MPVTRQTLALVRDLRVTVGAEADAATVALVKAWARSWTSLAHEFRAAMQDAVALQVELGHWPNARELARLERLRRVLVHVEAELLKLAQATGSTVSGAAGNAITATMVAEPVILASQLPLAERAAAAISFNRIPQAAIDAIIHRTTTRVTAQSWPLSDAALQAVNRELVRGVALGTGPRESARRMLAQVEGAFEGGRQRATTIARTETLDAYRTASRESHMANADVMAGWVWTSTLDRRSCVSCWAKHGSEHPVDEIGPIDHQNGRCARTPKLKSLRELGFNVDEPPDQFPDARARFNRLPKADQIQILGPERYELLRRGDVTWDDLARERSNPGWRPSVEPTPLRVLRDRARQAA